MSEPRDPQAPGQVRKEGGDKPAPQAPPGDAGIEKTGGDDSRSRAPDERRGGGMIGEG